MSVRLGYQEHSYDPIVLPIALGASRTLMEEDIEKALAKRLVLGPTRQLECHGYKPDLIFDGGLVVTIVEIKREIIGERAVEQITRYVHHWAEHLAEEDGAHVIYGILAAPRIRPAVASSLPSWCAFAPLDLRITQRGRR